MEKETLRKVQLVMVEMLDEIKRVCDAHNIQYFLTCGTCLGAIRHKGFIPWDDDVDIGMLREDYDKFCRIAPTALDPKYSLQEWKTDPNYANPNAKLRKNGTVYQEAKANIGGNNGIFIDVKVYDNKPCEDQWIAHRRKLYFLERLILMKCGYRPWKEDQVIVWKKRLFYVPIQVLSWLVSKEKLVAMYERRIRSVDDSSGNVNAHSGGMKVRAFPRALIEETMDVPFEGRMFPVPLRYHDFLTAFFGDYMQLPPEDQRENRHQIQFVDFGEE